MNFFTDNDDLQFHFRHGVAWGSFVPQWEDGFRAADGPGSLQEAVELYQTSLEEAGAYLAREVAPRARAIDEQGVGFADGAVVHPDGLLANIEGLKRMGLMAPCLPRAVGGFQFPFSAATFFMEGLSRACTNTLLRYAFYQGPAVMIWRFGTPDQVERWVKPLASGAISGSVAMTEPEAGSDVGNLSMRAEEAGGHWRLTGRKQFITNGCGEVCVVLARSEAGSEGLSGLSLFVAPRDERGRPNFVVAPPEKKNVIRGSATCELGFDGACAELLGPRGHGFAQILTFMNEARLAVAIQGLGIAEAARRAAEAYAAQRVQMGKPIARHELVADLLLDMEAETAALRALVYRCTQLQDRILAAELRGGDAGEVRRLKRALRDLTPVAKWFGSERVLWVTRAAVQVHGGYGVMRDYDVERHYRNALILPIYEGTSQIQALMSLKDQARWLFEKPWRVATGGMSAEAPPGGGGEAVREMAHEYNGALRSALLRGLGARGVLGVLGGRTPTAEETAYARLSAERLLQMLACTRAAEALGAHAAASAGRRRLFDRYAHRALPLVRMLGEVVRSGESSTLEALAR
ncbi:MAG TPA: acyl-CoA dehydrogenase family protein [Vicinamibacteria bacterium]|jgi:alkylation response protein AidB-like acyl-CoA dehydrogenase